MSNKFNFSTIEINGFDDEMSLLITKWEHRPTHSNCGGVGYFHKVDSKSSHCVIVSGSRANIEQMIREHAIKLYEDDSFDNLVKFADEILSKFISDKTSIREIEQDFYKFLESFESLNIKR